jgi:hypothetical protein
MSVCNNYFRFFSAELVAGRIPAYMQRGLVIDSEYATRVFGDASPLFHTVYINHEAWTIYGVVSS